MEIVWAKMTPTETIKAIEENMERLEEKHKGRREGSCAGPGALRITVIRRPPAIQTPIKQ